MFEDLSFLSEPRCGNKLRDVYFRLHYPDYYQLALSYTTKDYNHFEDFGLTPIIVGDDSE